ncbi:MAG: inositol monophosphatase family protein [Candidatus Micrarchaeia archaeon]
MAVKDLKKTLIEALQSAGKIQLENFSKKIAEKPKSLQDIVTKTDLECEKKIVKTILKRFPNHHILAEEGGEIGKKSDYTWIIDPLDGTINYANSMPYFCTVIALKTKKEVVKAGVFNPLTNQLFYAEKGKGATLNNKKIQCSQKENLNESVIAWSTTHHCTIEGELAAKVIEKIMCSARAYRLMGSSQLDFCNTARGMFDGMLKINSKPWDIAAGALIAQEAGCKVTEFNGKPWNLETKNIACANPKLHEKILELCKNCKPTEKQETKKRKTHQKEE